ncbi:MAG TPA: MBL fold metallo-hydrolase [Thermoleophilia bacterium]|nr:MBL fold metallo-hydrolase [Thermoleophilia bacterium]
MRLTYYGHASFLVETGDGTRVILDPYCSECYDGALRYTPIKETADVVIATHEHDDHGAVDSIPGQPLVFVHPVSETVGRLQITGVDVAHDDAGGSKRGRNTIVVLDDGSIKLVHLGDLGHLLDKTTIEAIGRVDVLIVPVGGYFTIDEKQAAAVVDSLHPKIVIPIHYKTDKVDFPIAPVDGFLKTQGEVQKPGTPTFEVTGDTLPEKRTTVVLPHSH